jgi:hypothetical protein
MLKMSAARLTYTSCTSLQPLVGTQLTRREEHVQVAAGDNDRVSVWAGIPVSVQEVAFSNHDPQGSVGDAGAARDLGRHSPVLERVQTSSQKLTCRSLALENVTRMIPG